MPLPPERCMEYDAAFSAFLSEAIEALMKAKDPVYAQIPRETSEFVPESSVEPTQFEPTELVPLEMGADLTFSFDAIAGGDVSEVAILAERAADEFLAQLMPQIFQHISAVCDATGNVVQTRGGELSWDVILDMLEKVEFTFDHNGEPQLPTLVMHPSMADRLAGLGPPTEEQERRRQQIIAKKREEHDRRRRSRRLS